jgi:hypothetical protein
MIPGYTRRKAQGVTVIFFSLWVTGLERQHGVWSMFMIATANDYYDWHTGLDCGLFTKQCLEA